MGPLPTSRSVLFAFPSEPRSVRYQQEGVKPCGGCFWGMQDLLRRYPSVISTRVGYTGGDVPNATYRNHGTHAEAIEVVFDPALPIINAP
jgi:peptide methionine sulfoxide reductase MsrA